MKKHYFFFCLPLLAIFFTNCAPTLELQSVESPTRIDHQKVHYYNADSTYALSGTSYQFPGALGDIQYMPQWQMMTANFLSEERKPAYTVYDLKTDQPNWVNKGNYQLALLQRDVAMVSYQDKKVLLNAQNGLPIRWVDGEDFVVIDDSVTLKLADQFSRVNIKTGQQHWSRQGEKQYAGWMADELDGNWMYVVGDGLHGFDLTTGEGWYHQANTEYEATRGKRAIANGALFAFNVLSLSFGGVSEFGYLQPLRAHNVHAKPKIMGNDLFFADRTEIVRLDKQTGELIWAENLMEELGVSDLKILDNNRLLLVSKGYRYVNYALDKDKPAMLYSVNADKGRIINKIQLTKNEVIQDYAVNDAYIYTVTKEKIYQYDHILGSEKTIELPTVYGAPLRVVAWSSSAYDELLQTDKPDFPLVIRTMQGVVALHPVTLEELWYQRLGTVVQEKPQLLGTDYWQMPILLNEIDQNRFWVEEDTETFWFARARKIVGLDLSNNGKIIGEFDLPSDDFWFLGNGEMVQYEGREVRILRLKTN